MPRKCQTKVAAALLPDIIRGRRYAFMKLQTTSLRSDSVLSKNTGWNKQVVEHFSRSPH